MMHNNEIHHLLRKLSPLLLSLLCLFSLPSYALYCATPGDQGTSNNEGGNINATGKVDYFQPGNQTVAMGSTSITMSSTSDRLKAGNMVLIIQMQGADIDSSNNLHYGDGINAEPASGWISTNFTAGYYEYATVASRTNSAITLAAPLKHRYVQANASTSQGKRRFQVIRVPQYTNLSLTSNVTGKAWDGNTGGVLPLDVADTLNFNGHSITMAAKGFRGGGGRNHTGRSGLSNADFRQPSQDTNSGAHGSKGEGIAGTPRYTWDGTSSGRQGNTAEGYPNGSYAMGAPANAGGGGTDGMPSSNEENAGGGGGGNGGAGGRGGNSWRTNLPTGGWGGAAFVVAAANRIVMGGGGGAGTMNNSTATSPQTGPHGGVGGGIVLIRAGKITGNGTINANGSDGISALNDGSGGGGAGGSVVVIANSQTGSLTINAKGGNGGNVNFSDPHGPGGGGGGGVVFTNSAVSASVDASQGQSGRAGPLAGGGYEYFGATPSGGVSGNTIPNMSPSDIDGTDPGANCLEYQSDLSITKTRHSGSMVAAGTAEFKIEVENLGPDATTAPIVVTDVLDSKFTYTGFTGAGWACAFAGQTVTCTRSAALAMGAKANDLFIQVSIASTGAGQAVSNTASVSLATDHNNSDPNTDNNSSTINDIIYNLPAAGSKWLYIYPENNSSNRKLSRVVPSTVATQTIVRGGANSSDNYADYSLSPTLTGVLNANGNIYVRICMKPSDTANQNRRDVEAFLYRDNPNDRIGSVDIVRFSNHNWLFHIFEFQHTGTTTIPSGADLRLRLRNISASGTNSVDISNNANNQCAGDGNSRVEIDTDTVINVDTVTVFNQAHPAGTEIQRVVEGSTVYVRSGVTDPFGHADINNNSTVSMMSGGTLLAGPFPQTQVISASGNAKEFEYAITLPTVAGVGHYVLSVTANEGTEGTIQHSGIADIELTSDPALTVTKTTDKTHVLPGEDVVYTLVISNSSDSAAGDAYQIVVIDKLPEFTSLQLGTPLITFTDGAVSTSFDVSGLTELSTEYSNDNGATWGYVPLSEAGGAPVGYDGAVQQIRKTFTGKMQPNTAFTLQYTLRLD